MAKSLFASIALLVLGSPALRAGSPAASESQATNEIAPIEKASDPLAIFQAPLLREGSHIVEAPAVIRHDEETGVWKATLTAAQPAPQPAAATEFILMPCTRLTEMQRIVQSAAAGDPPITFQLTGRVYVFRGRNYLLPTHAPILQAAPSQSQSKPAATSQETAAPPTGDSQPSAPPRASDIMRDLEQSTGPLTRSPAPRTPAQVNAARTSQGQKTSKTVVREESLIINRRGRITRDRVGGTGATNAEAGAAGGAAASSGAVTVGGSGGDWMFVFDADASGLSDPPMRLLPCLLLERIENYARTQASNAPAPPALLSGQAYVYQGEAYLLPTVFHIPRDRTPITP